ncbi:VOC family protein [Fontibacillus sp. BL9]|uniref:VOC family protein n=1 Tax=Fontibacillus sp. BL9 TaxID=3389971 RepID=UPI00397C80D4
MTTQMNPYIFSNDARAQAEFYSSALGGEIQSVMTFGQIPGTPEENKDKVMHMVLTVAGGNVLFLSDSFEPVTANSSRSMALALTFNDLAKAQEAYAGLGKGGTDKYPLELQPWGAHYGEVEDKFGILWQVTTQG